MPLRSLRLLTALLAAVLAPGLARAGETEHAPTQVVDGYTVTIALPPDPVETGPNDLVITIHTTDGAPVSDAAVTVAVVAYAAEGGHGASETPAASQEAAPSASHSADHGASTTDQAGASAKSHDGNHTTDGHGHEAIPTMLEAGVEPGTYRGTLHLDQAGTATVTVAFTVAGQERAARFAIPVVQARPRALVLGGFALVNGLAIVAAAVLKRRMPQKQRKVTARPAVIALSATPAVSEEEGPA